MGEDQEQKGDEKPPHRSFSQWFKHVLPSSWGTDWEHEFSWKPGHDDYRDRLPTPLDEVVREYQDMVAHGRWTFGLCQCWGKRSKVVKSAVHVPCCPSFRFLPWRWRGVCFGRTFMECCWYGCDRLRWARTTHALGLGREYTVPFHEIGSEYHSSICALCWFQVCVGCAAGLGLGQAFSLCGNVGANFGAFYSCHAREKLRRKYDLPPTFGLCPGIDDCLVHFFCMYCASHQEMRECAVRGLDGPGLYALDVHPQTWAHLPGYEEALARRAAHLETLKERGDLFLPFEQRMSREPGPAQIHGKEAMHAVQAVFSHGRGSDDPGGALLAAGPGAEHPAYGQGGPGGGGGACGGGGSPTADGVVVGQVERDRGTPRGAVPTQVLLGRLAEQEQPQGRQPLPRAFSVAY